MNKNKLLLWSSTLVALLLLSTSLPVQASNCPKLARRYNVSVYSIKGVFTPEVGASTYFLQSLGGNRYEVTSLGEKRFDLTQNCNTVQFLYHVPNAIYTDQFGEQFTFEINWICNGQIRSRGRKIIGACRDEALKSAGANLDFTFKWTSAR